MRFAPREKTEFIDPLHDSSTSHPVAVVDNSWIHLGGASYRSMKFREGYDFYQRIAKAADEGATLQMLVKK